MDHDHVTDLHMLAADDVITIIPKPQSAASEPYRATVRDVYLPTRDSLGGVWTYDFEWVPLKRIV